MKVFLNGCWDSIHVGHVNILLFARGVAGAGKVIVAVDEDEKVMADKGLQRPIYNVHERAKALLDLRMPDQTPVVDEVMFFHTNLELQMIIKRLVPDYIVKGGDWRDKYVIGSNVSKVLYYDRIGEYSTTDTVHRVREKYKNVNLKP